MKKYQDQLYKALMNPRAMPDFTSVNPLKRQTPDPQDPSDGERTPKRTAMDRSGAGVSPQSVETTAEALSAPETGQGDHDSGDMHRNAYFDTPTATHCVRISYGVLTCYRNSRTQTLMIIMMNTLEPPPHKLFNTSMYPQTLKY
jgi:hypothetical protein